MKITFEIPYRDAPTKADTNRALLEKLKDLGHTLDPEITKIVLHPSASDTLKQDAWKFLFRSIGVVKLETMADDSRNCHRFVMHFPGKEPATP